MIGFLSFRNFGSLTVEIQVEKSLISTAVTFIGNIIPMKAKSPIMFCLYNVMRNIEYRVNIFVVILQAWKFDDRCTSIDFTLVYKIQDGSGGSIHTAGRI